MRSTLQVPSVRLAALFGVAFALATSAAAALCVHDGPALDGLWRYETLARGGGPPVPVAGLFLFKSGSFVQQSINAGEPFERQLAQAHAGTYRIGGDKLHMLAEVGIVVDPTSGTPVESRDGSVHEVTVRQDADRLTLTFGTGTVQTFTRVSSGTGDVILLERGALGLVDGRFVLAAENARGTTSGSGTFERQGETLRLRAEAWIAVDGGQPTYSRDRLVTARLTGAALTIGDLKWPVRSR
jgi:hypothetical protein